MTKNSNTRYQVRARSPNSTNTEWELLYSGFSKKSALETFDSAVKKKKDARVYQPGGALLKEHLHNDEGTSQTTAQLSLL